MEWTEIARWALEAILTGAGVYIANKADKILESINRLTETVSVLTERSQNQEKRIDRIDLIVSRES